MQANHALKYKAGVAPQRKSKIKLSEYQKEFNWKQGKAASPLLTAEQVSRNYSGLRVHKLKVCMSTLVLRAKRKRLVGHL